MPATLSSLTKSFNLEEALTQTPVRPRAGSSSPGRDARPSAARRANQPAAALASLRNGDDVGLRTHDALGPHEPRIREMSKRQLRARSGCCATHSDLAI